MFGHHTTLRKNVESLKTIICMHLKLKRDRLKILCSSLLQFPSCGSMSVHTLYAQRHSSRYETIQSVLVRAYRTFYVLGSADDFKNATLSSLVILMQYFETTPTVHTYSNTPALIITGLFNDI